MNLLGAKGRDRPIMAEGRKGKKCGGASTGRKAR